MELQHVDNHDGPKTSCSARWSARAAACEQPRKRADLPFADGGQHVPAKGCHMVTMGTSTACSNRANGIDRLRADSEIGDAKSSCPKQVVTFFFF